MDFYDLVGKRESIRNYDPEKKVDSETLKRILEAGMFAPTAHNNQPFRFIVVMSDPLMTKVKAAYTRKEWFKDVQQVLIIVGEKDKAWERDEDGYNSLETDVTIAMDHMILAAEYEGVATCWIEAYNPSVLAKALELKDNERIYSITPLGYPKKDFTKKGKKVRKSYDDVVTII